MNPFGLLYNQVPSLPPGWLYGGGWLSYLLSANSKGPGISQERKPGHLGTVELSKEAFVSTCFKVNGFPLEIEFFLCSQPRGCRPCGAESILLLEQANSFDIWEALGWNFHLLPRDMLWQPIDCNCLTCTKLLPPSPLWDCSRCSPEVQSSACPQRTFQPERMSMFLLNFYRFILGWDQGASPGSEPCLDLGFQKAQIPFSLCWLIFMFTGCRHTGLYL